MLLTGLKSGQAYGLDPASGKQIWMTRVSAGNTLGGIEWRGAATQPFETVNGVAASSGSLDHGGATVAGGMLYVNSRYGRINGQPGKRIAGIRGRALKFTA